MFKMILSAIVALGFSVIAHAQEPAAPAPAEPAKMEAPAAPSETVAKKKKHGKKKKKDAAPAAEEAK